MLETDRDLAPQAKTAQNGATAAMDHLQRRAAPEEAGVAGLLVALIEVIRAIRLRPIGLARLRASLGNNEIAARHILALTHLAVSGSMSVSELASRLGVTRTTASLIVSELAQSGLAERSEDADDHRRTIVSIASSHRDDVDRAVELRLEPLRRAVRILGPHAATTLTAGLNVLAGELSRPPGSQASPGSQAGPDSQASPGSQASPAQHDHPCELGQQPAREA